MKLRIATSMCVLALVVAGTTAGQASTAQRYAGGGTVAVAKINGVTVVDNGAAICRPGGDSSGGACVPFKKLSDDRHSMYLGVEDDTYGEDVAFQVCIDNNGDGVCGGPDGVGSLRCGDDQFFSHGEDGRFFNPLGPLPTSFRADCPGSAEHAGYVVFLCTGVHSPSADDSHTHLADAGAADAIELPTDKPSYGTFCGGSSGGSAIPVNTDVLQAKPYRVE